LIEKNDESCTPKFTLLETISEVVYEGLSKPEISDDSITFYYPGLYRFIISDEKSDIEILINVINNNTKYNTAKLQSDSITKPPIKESNDDVSDGLYSLYIPFLFYITLDDHFEALEEYPYQSYKGSDIEDNAELIKKLIDNKQIRISVNDEPHDIVIDEDGNYSVKVTDLTEKENTFELKYYYQGFNGEIVTLTQTIKFVVEDSGNIKVSQVK
jgi:hypothetical protein